MKKRAIDALVVSAGSLSAIAQKEFDKLKQQTQNKNFKIDDPPICKYKLQMAS